MKDKHTWKRKPTLEVKTQFQRRLMWMICAAMAMPTVVLGGTIYLIVARLSSPIGAASPHEVTLDITKYVAVLFPLLSAALLYWVFSGTNKLVGPLERIIHELEQRIEGQESGPIVLRPGDQLIPLVDKINTLLNERDGLKKP